MGIPANQKTERKVRAKVRDKNEKRTPGKSKTRKGGLGKNGYPGGLKTRKGGPAKRGIKSEDYSLSHLYFVMLRQLPSPKMSSPVSILPGKVVACEHSPAVLSPDRIITLVYGLFKPSPAKQSFLQRRLSYQRIG
ncbi:hypothetical protein KIW84_052654 [Lathyrus oleraceus]|uniref:Uncharacterized protein n=1 Tax=Pisum sativum TaxID=3888 RepID=A0A9D5AC85_PEA|nr:hypothetical protein KIW84_052654 [Pisum sativum]